MRLAVAILMLFCGDVVLASPQEALAAALRNAETLPQDVRVRSHYFWLNEPTLERKFLALEVLSSHANCLSREPYISTPTVIMSDGSERKWPKLNAADVRNAVLVRVSRDDYRWRRSVFEQLKEQGVFFHVQVEVNQEYGYRDAYGRWVTTEWRKEKQFASAPWLNAKDIGRLIELTQTDAPILHAGNFVWQTAIQTDRKVGYYGLLEIKDQASYEKLIGFDKKVSADFTKELLAAVANSGVSQQPRRVARFEKVGGAYWVTFDNKLAVNERNPLRLLNKGFEFDASETFGHLANGLWVTGLFDKDGNRQDSAPDFVGFNHKARSNNGRIEIHLSCHACHSRGGLRDINDWIRNLYRPPVTLQSPDYDELLEIRRKYLRRLEPHLEADRQRHNEALKECGADPFSFASNLQEYFYAYDAGVDLQRAAFDCGVPEEVFVRSLQVAAKQGGIDTVLGIFLRPKEEQEAIPIDQWHEVYPLAMQILIGNPKGTEK